MIASSYIVNVYDLNDKLLASAIVFSYDEAYWQIGQFATRYYDDAVKFELVLPAEKIIDRKEKTE